MRKIWSSSQRAQDARVQRLAPRPGCGRTAFRSPRGARTRLAVLVFLVGQLRPCRAARPRRRRSGRRPRDRRSHCRRCRAASRRRPARRRSLSYSVGLGQIALHIGHRVGQPLPGRFVDLVDAEFRVGVADEALQHVVQSCVAPALRRLVRREPRRSARNSPAAVWCAPGCRAPAPPAAWSDRRWRRRSPWRRDRPGARLACAAPITGAGGVPIGWRHIAPRGLPAVGGSRRLRALGSLASAALDMAAEAEAHRRQHLLARRCAPGASGSGRRARRPARRPAPLPRSPPRPSSGLRRNPRRSRRSFASSGSSASAAAPGRAARTRPRCRAARLRRCRPG